MKFQRFSVRKPCLRWRRPFWERQNQKVFCLPSSQQAIKLRRVNPAKIHLDLLFETRFKKYIFRLNLFSWEAEFILTISFQNTREKVIEIADANLMFYISCYRMSIKMAEYRTDVLFIKLFIRFFGKNCENKENIVFLHQHTYPASH